MATSAHMSLRPHPGLLTFILKSHRMFSVIGWYLSPAWKAMDSDRPYLPPRLKPTKVSVLTCGDSFLFGLQGMSAIDLGLPPRGPTLQVPDDQLLRGSDRQRCYSEPPILTSETPNAHRLFGVRIDVLYDGCQQTD